MIDIVQLIPHQGCQFPLTDNIKYVLIAPNLKQIPCGKISEDLKKTHVFGGALGPRLFRSENRNHDIRGVACAPWSNSHTVRCLPVAPLDSQPIKFSLVLSQQRQHKTLTKSQNPL